MRDLILAIDASTVRTGLCLGGPASDCRPRAWTVKLPGADKNVFDRTLSMAADTVSLWCRNEQVAIVAIEAPLILMDSEHSTAALVALVQLTGAIRAAAHRAGARVVLYAVSKVRVHFVGQGYPPNPKRAVMARCKMLGYEFSDDNAADALALWDYTMSQHYAKAWAGQNAKAFVMGSPR